VLTPEADPTIDNRTFVLILQHPQERREPRATAAAAVSLLRRARLVAGLSWPNLARPLGRDSQPIADPAPVLRGLDGIVLLDGTWSQAKTLWWRNPWLLKLHRIVLNPPRPARLARLRREPRREAVSTLESAALVLRHLERGPEAADALLAALERIMAAARPDAADPTQPAGG